jgi:hypothetical protein
VFNRTTEAAEQWNMNNGTRRTRTMEQTEQLMEQVLRTTLTHVS